MRKSHTVADHAVTAWPLEMGCIFGVTDKRVLLWSFLDLLSLIYYAECIYSAVRVYNTISSIGKQPTVTLSTGIFFPMAVEYDRNY